MVNKFNFLTMIIIFLASTSFTAIIILLKSSSPSACGSLFVTSVARVILQLSVPIMVILGR